MIFDPLCNPAQLETSERTYTRPGLDSFALILMIVPEVPNRTFNRIFGRKNDFPALRRPRCRRCSLALLVFGRRTQRVNLELFCRFSLQLIPDLLDFVSLPGNHQMDVLFRDRTGPDREGALAKRICKPNANGASLLTFQGDRRIQQSGFGGSSNSMKDRGFS